MHPPIHMRILLPEGEALGLHHVHRGEALAAAR
jgi:hypothetical protein